MLGHGIAPNRSTESLHLLERMQHTVWATFRGMLGLVGARGVGATLSN
jgi:hypothetical protein